MYHRILFTFLTFFLVYSCAVKKEIPQQFEGKLVYQLSGRMITKGAPDSTDIQIVYAKDSLLRVESFTNIGKQVYIKHIPKNRAYILMDLGGQKVAIQTIPEPSPNAGKYIFQPKRKRKTFAGQRANSVEVKIPNIDSTFSMFYLPHISPEYSEAIPGIAGLPVKYTIFSNDELIDYELIEFDEKTINRDLFGIPSDHQIITMDDFIQMIQEGN